MSVNVTYQRKEKITVISYDGKDYLVKDEDTEKHYLIDATYFRRHYEAIENTLPVHTELWDKLQQQAETLHKLKRANSRLKSELRSERRVSEKLRKERSKKEPLRKGQKRGKHGRNG